MSDQLIERLLAKAQASQIPLSATQAATLIDYINLLQKWNRTHNLTAIKSADEILDKHLIDSLSIWPYIPQGRILDVGSGAGFPGIPLALILPDRQFELVDANHKKVAFLNEASRALRLTNLQAQHQRVEKLTGDRFSAITCRAFSSIEDFIHKTSHLLAPEGVWLAMKGLYPTEELQQLETDLFDIVVHTLDVDKHRQQRHLVEITRCQSQ